MTTMSVAIPHGGLRTEIKRASAEEVEEVAIPHGGLRTAFWRIRIVKRCGVAIPHGGLRTRERDTYGNVYYMSPSHTVGLEHARCLPPTAELPGRHPTRWA